jgi:uncharacterized protein (TIGR02145 family)
MMSAMRAAAIALSVACASVGTISSTRDSAQDSVGARAISASTLMADGKYWTTTNLDVAADPSYCYDDQEANCRRYGRLYTWDSAQRGCRLLGDRWRLPTNDEWRNLAKHYGGVRDDSADGGKAAYTAFVLGGRAGFGIVFGGGRASDGQYARLDAHGLYWTASASGPTTAWIYNLGRGGQIVNRHSNLEKQWAFSVRCIRE